MDPMEAPKPPLNFIPRWREEEEKEEEEERKEKEEKEEEEDEPSKISVLDPPLRGSTLYYDCSTCWFNEMLQINKIGCWSQNFKHSKIPQMKNIQPQNISKNKT